MNLPALASTAAVERLLQRQLKDERTPGISYALFSAQDALYAFEGGTADFASGRAVDENTTFHGYSVTKTFTALAIVELAQRGLLQLDDPVQRYLPDFPYGPAITVRQLLSHSSGLPNPIPLSWIHLAGEHAAFDEKAFFADVIARNPRTRSAPNAKFAYSNLNYIVLGWLIEQLTGKPYRVYIAETIIAPLGLDEPALGFTVADPGRHATGYHRRYTFSSWLLGWFIPKKKFMGEAHGPWRPFRPFYVNGAPYGGLIGTKNGFVRYVQGLLQNNSAIVSHAGKTALFAENRMVVSKHIGMALSWFTGTLEGHTYFAHAGGGGGYYCELRVYPDDGLGSVVFFNRTGMTDERFLDQTDRLLLTPGKNSA
jgi:D-alanyl-D-alanine carboxypeptidase